MTDVPNGDFETGDLTSWTQGTDYHTFDYLWEVKEAAKRSGDYGLSLVMTAGDYGANGSVWLESDPFTPPLDTDTLSLYLKINHATGNTGGVCSVWVYITGSNGEEVIVTYSSADLLESSEGDWIELSGEMSDVYEYMVLNGIVFGETTTLKIEGRMDFLG